MTQEHARTYGTPGGGSLGSWIRQTWAFAQRYGRELFRNKMVLFWSVAFPVGFYLLTITVFLDGNTIPAEYMPQAKAGIAVGYGMFGAIIASLNSFGQQLAADFEADRYLQFRSLPLAPSADLAGRMVAGLALSGLSFAVAVVVAAGTGGAFSLRSVVSPAVVVVAVVTFAVFWMVVAVALSTLVRDTRYASIITVSLALVAYFLSGYNGTDPSSFEGPAVALNLMPHTLATRLVSHHTVVYGGDVSPLAPPAVPSVAVGLGLLVLYAVVSLGLGALVMRRVVYKKGGIA